MRFKLSTAGDSYGAADKVRYEKLGFRFRESGTKVCDSVFIEFKTLEELVAFAKDFGLLVLDSDSIEIYDDYRE